MGIKQRQHHRHLRTLAAIKSGRRISKPRTLRERSLEGHRRLEHSAGDGHTSPREAWGTCTCGILLWSYMQPYGVETITPWAKHLNDIKSTRNPLIQYGGKQ